MRRLLLILAAMIVAAIAFVLYIAWQTPGGHANVGGDEGDTHLHATTLNAATESVTGVGAGQGVWWNQYDNNGNLTSIIRATTYTPRASGTLVDVQSPVAEFFLAQGRRMVLTGDTGVINVEQRPAGHKTMTGGSSDAAPTSGFLFNVIVKVFEPTAPDHPTMTLTTNNVSFDNQTFRIATESYSTPDNHLIAADQVPVQVRGDEVDFDGRGLVARYDDFNERIALLQIAHGEQMVLKHVATLASTTRPAKSAATQSAQVAAAEATPGPTEAAPTPTADATAVASPTPATPETSNEPALASDSPKPAPPTPPAPAGKGKKSPATKPGRLPPTAYRATFFTDVHVTQDGQPLAESDIMAVDFMPNQSGANDTTQPSAAKPKPPASPKVSRTGTPQRTTASSQRAASSSSAPSTRVASTSAAATSEPTTAAATEPAYPPGAIVVKWTGPMRLVAVDRNTVVPLSPGDSAITATGNPVVLHQPSGVAHCGSMLYASSDKSMHLRTSTSQPAITFIDTPGQTHLTCMAADYVDTGRTAIITGPATLTMDQPAKVAGQPPTHMLVTWTDRAVARLFDTPSNAVQHVDVTGNVHVNHPQMKMVSDAITLVFQPDPADAGKSLLNQMISTGSVECDLSDALHPGRRLTSDRLVVSTIQRPNGGIFPNDIVATGNAHATDADQAITAEMMHATLAPKIAVATTAPARPASTQPNALASAGDQAELKTFLATGTVAMTSSDSYATADRVFMDQTSGHPHIELDGAPASVRQQGRTITGPIITAQPDDGLAAVHGAGTLHAIVDSATTKPAGAAVAGSAASPNGAATAAAASAGGTFITPAPAASSATASASAPRRSSRAGAATRPTTRPIDIVWATGANFDGPNNLVTFKDHVVIDTRDADGTARHATCDGMDVTLRTATTRPARAGAAPTVDGGQRSGALIAAATPAQTASPASPPRTTRRGTTQPTTAPSGFKDKAVAAVTLHGSVTVDSVLLSPAGVMQQRSSLRTQKLTANLDDQQQLLNIDVPVPGQAFSQDFRAAPPGANANAPSGNGATAVGWSKNFRLDEQPEKVATFTGDVHVHHDPPAGAGGDSMDLTSSKLIVTFKPDVKTPHPTTRSTTQPAPIVSGVQQVYAVAPVNVKARTLDLDAQALQFTPDDHLAVLTGSDRQPVEGVTGDEHKHVSFLRAVIDTQTQLIVDSSGVQATGGR